MNVNLIAAMALVMFAVAPWLIAWAADPERKRGRR